MSGRIELSTITSLVLCQNKSFISIAPGAYMEEPTILQFNLQEKANYCNHCFTTYYLFP